MAHQSIRIHRNILVQFCQTVFQQLQLKESDARIASEVLVAADARGIPSHGVGRLERYVNGLTTGLMLPNAPIEIVKDTPVSIVLDAHGAMGAPVSVQAMQTVIAKARTQGAAFGCVKDSNHFGIAGYYAQMALPHDMLGIAMTNTAALGVPTFGRLAMFGTNPLAFAAPADEEQAFVLDMSTTVVTRGKIEVYDRLGKALPEGWAVEKTGLPATNAQGILADMREPGLGGGILPLGGWGTDFSGHKGYGLAVMVDILCAVLGGAAFGVDVFDTPTSSARVSHFFGALKIDCFRDPQGFRNDMDRMLRTLRQSPPAEGEERVYFAGLPEMEKEQESHRLGVELLPKTYDALCALGKEYDVPPPLLAGDLATSKLVNED